MKYLILTIVIAAVAIASGCGGAAENTQVANATNTAPAKPAGPVPPTMDDVLTMEKKAFEAFQKKEGKLFDEMLSEKFVMFGPDGSRIDKAATVKMINEHKCTIGNFAFSDEHLTVVGKDSGVLTAKAQTDNTCDGKKMPSPVTISTVSVRDGERWRPVYHNEVPIVEPKDFKASKPSAGKKAADAAKPDATTETLMALEKKGWDAWMARDAKALGEMTHNDVTYVDMFGRVHKGREAAMKAWIEPKCEIKSVAVSDGAGVSIAPDASMLTYKGTAVGTCNGQPLGPLWGTSVFVKDGDAWKLIYMFETAA